MIYPAVRVPLIATSVWVLMNDDPAVLEILYPRISSIVMSGFTMEKMTGDGFIPGDGGNGQGEVHISPVLNSLGCLELHSLSLIAAACGRHEEAMELRNWADAFSGIITNTFYDSSHDCFYPLSDEGHFIVGYSPSLLIPLVTDRTISPAVRKRMADRLLYNIENGRGSSSYDILWTDASLRQVVINLLSGVRGFPASRLTGIAESPILRPRPHSYPSPAGWTAIWKGTPASELLFPPSEGIMSLILFRDTALREDILKEELIASIGKDVDGLVLALSSAPAGIEEHVSNIQLVNSLLLRMSEVSEHLESGERLWKVLDDDMWKRLSPRTKKMFSIMASTSIKELNSIKSDLTALLLESTGIDIRIGLPDMAVPVGNPIDLKISISSPELSFDMKSVYLQSSGRRWDLSTPQDVFRLGPGLPPVEWTRTLRLPPGSTTGIVPLPLFIDFMKDGKRVELHIDECLTMTTGYEVTLDMPSGMMLTSGSAIPVNISLRYLANATIHGQVDGVFLDELTCVPSLPARFAVTGGSDLTQLPLEIRTAADPSPGRYPFMLSIELDGKRIASFEKDLFVPVEWLHVGPISNRRWALEEGYQLQDDFSSTYYTPEGKELKWERVAKGALGPSGEVLPGHLYGSGSNRSMLLYTMVTVPAEKSVYWTLSTTNITSLWINSDPVLLSSDEGGTRQGTAVLRKGRNSILLGSYWPGHPSGIDFRISDDSGLPVAEMINDVNVLPEPAMVASGDIVEDPEPGTAVAGKDIEVSFKVDRPEASEVSVIGAFNNWDPEATQMRKGSDGRWYVSIFLPRGRHTYKFLVDRSVRMTDPSNDDSEPDGFGGMNSVIVVK